MSVPAKFKGFGVDVAENWNKPKLVEYEHKPLRPNDVVVKNVACGLCGSDILTVSGKWSPLKRKDLVVGHEIIGHVVHVGDAVTQVKVGDRVGIGAHSQSCMKEDCGRCQNDNEQYCQNNGVGTYNSIDKSADDYVTQGGYSNYSIAHEQFCFPIPDGLDSNVAAPLMCAGLTVFSPLVRNVGYDAKGKTVGVIGIGGLGHLAIQFAAALGAEVVAFSRGNSKKEEAIKMGALKFVATGEEKNWTENYKDKFDFILCAASGSNLNMEDYFSVLKVGANLVSVGLPPTSEKYEVSPFSFLSNGGSFGSTLLGSKKEMLELLKIAVENDVKPWIEEIPISEKNCNIALTRADEGDIRYRFVFTEFDKAFE